VFIETDFAGEETEYGVAPPAHGAKAVSPHGEPRDDVGVIRQDFPFAQAAGGAEIVIGSLEEIVIGSPSAVHVRTQGEAAAVHVFILRLSRLNATTSGSESTATKALAPLLKDIALFLRAGLRMGNPWSKELGKIIAGAEIPGGIAGTPLTDVQLASEGAIPGDMAL